MQEQHKNLHLRRFRPAWELLESRLCPSAAANQALVAQLYRGLLNRAPDSRGLAYWSSLLDQGTPARRVALRIENSREYDTDKIEQYYETYLLRPADQRELGRFGAYLRSGGTLLDVQASILGSPAYVQNRGGGTSTGFLAALFYDVLGRPVNPSGARAWNKFLAERHPRESNPYREVAAAVLNSLEARQDFLQSTYQQFLDHPLASAAERSWLAFLNAGGTEQAVLARILGSREYFALATAPPASQPTVVIESPGAGVATNHNLVVVGHVEGTSGGVATLQVQVDSGTFSKVTLDRSESFQFTTSLPLNGSADGAHTIFLHALGNSGAVLAAATLPFTLDTLPPVVTITGPAANVVSNQNVTVTGTVSDATSGVAELEEAVDSRSGPFAPVSVSVAGGRFSFTTTLATDGTADGPHIVYIEATDQAGNVSPLSSLPFTLKTSLQNTSPAVPTVDLAPGTANLGPETTSSSQVTLVGQASPGNTITLVGTSSSALASATGTFQIPGVTLTPGENVLTVQAVNPAGKTADSSALTVTYTPPTTATPPNAVILWNQATLNAIQNDGTDPLMASRALAMVQAAVYDAVNNVDGTPAHFVQVSAPKASDINAAIDAAAHDVLVYLYPDQQAALDALLTSQLALLPSGQGIANGETVGQAVGNAIIALRANDGATNYVNYEPGSAPGDWQPTAPAFAPALDPQGADMTPWAMTSPGQFDTAGPPALSSAQWAAAVNQVESLGAVNSTTRTAAETTLAKFWNDGVGTDTPSGHWNAIAETVAQQEGDSLVDDARLFAELDITMADAGIASWNTKYLYDTWRPITVIQDGGDGVNPAVTADPTWQPLLVTPNFPEYVSGHSVFSAAAATVLDSFFGDNVTFTTTEPTTTLSLTYTSFQQAAQDAGMSRLYGGIHFLFSIQDGWTVGDEVANWDLATFNTTRNTTPPRVTLDNVLPSGASKTNVTITGTVTDDLSGVTGLQVQVDSARYAPMSFDAATGRFSFTTSFSLNGSADGSHTINFQAADAAGNVAAPVAFTFTLATNAPTIALTSPTAASALAASTNLTGTVKSEASVVSLWYAFDGSTTRMPVTLNSNDTFSQTLDLSKLAAGSHTLLVEAQDAAGNTTTQTLKLTMAAPIPLQVATVTPTDGANDVGVTFRPEVTFSRAVNTATLSSANFYATDPAGAVIPATIVPSDDGTYAWLFFTNPMPGGSTITLTVNGSSIKSADGSLLDAADDGTPGSVLTETFTTVSTTPVAGTTLSGIVADPGPDDQPGTRDDVRVGPSGVLGAADTQYLRPIEGVEVYILGMEGQAVYTNAQGQFSFSSVPSGDVKLAVEGNVPGVMVYDPNTQALVDPTSEGFYFPQMTLDLTIQPGIANTVMGSMGTQQEETSNAANLGVYLPRVQSSILQTVSNTQPTTVGVTGPSGLGLTPQQQQELTMTVQPGSAVGPDGQKMSNVQVGISTVPPAIVMDMLPTGVMQHTFDITIQAPGVTTFSTPAQLTFPNVFDAAPGTQLDVLSFDHTTGRLVIDGTATVSADGLSVVTDPGTGVTQPGWHGLTPPGSRPLTPKPPIPATPAVPVTPQPTPIIHVLPLLSGDTPSPDQLDAFRVSPPADGSVRTVTVTVDSQLQDVLQDETGPLGQALDIATSTIDVPLAGGSWTLDSDSGGVTFNWGGIPDETLQAEQKLNDFVIYGGVVTVDAVTKMTGASSSPPVETIDQFFMYRYLNPLFATQSVWSGLVSVPSVNADQLPFPDAIEMGPGHSVQNQTLALNISQEAAISPTLNTGADFSVMSGGGSAIVTFDPVGAQTYNDTLILRPGVQLRLNGTGMARQIIYVNEPALVSMLTNIENNALPGALPYSLTTDETTAFSAADVQSTANAIFNIVASLYSGNSAIDESIDVEPGTGDDGTTVVYSTSKPGQTSASTSLTTGSTGVPFGTGIDNLSTIQRLVAATGNLPTAVSDYLLPQAINVNRIGVTTIFTVSVLVVARGLPSFESVMAWDIAHEIGHTLSLVHIQGKVDGGNYNVYTPPDGELPDVMSYDQPGPYAFVRSLPALQLALDQTVTDANVLAAESYYSYSATSSAAEVETPEPDVVPAASESDEPTVGGDPIDYVNTPVPGKFLSISQANTLDLATSANFGEVTVGSSALQQFVVQNVGSNPVTITNAALSGSPEFGLVLPEGFAGELAPDASLQFGVQYVPDLGPAEGTVTIESDALPVVLTLSGQGTLAGPAAQVDEANNNLGGALIGDSVTDASAIIINNDGSSPLTITGVSIIYGATSFRVNGLPADLATDPITIARNGSYSLSVTYTASQQGLERGLIQLATNDPNNATIKVGVVGTGVDADSVGNWGDDYVAIAFPQLGANATIRVMSDADGNFDAFLPASTQYEISVFDPKSDLIAHEQGSTGAFGQPIDITGTLTFKPSTAPDTDNAGLPDDIKFALGLNPDLADTSGNGVDDFTKLQEGLPLFSNQSAITGVVASLDLAGQANAVTLQGSSTSSQGQTAYVATGPAGLAIVNVSNFQKPILMSQIPLDGNSSDVAVDADLQIAAVASNAGGLNLVDVSDPTDPAVRKTVPVDASLVRVASGVAYAAVDGDVQAYDLLTGDLLQTLAVSSGKITGIAVDGAFLYTLDSGNTLQVIDLSSGQMVARGSVLLAPSATLANGSGALLVGDGVAYIAVASLLNTSNGVYAGYITANVSNPDSPQATSGEPSLNAAGTAVAATGSGIAVTVGSDLSGPALDVFDSTDPTNVSQFLTEFSLPAAGSDVAIGDGLAFVADGTGGLQIVNDLPFDTKGVPPTASISLPASAIASTGADGNPQVLEGSTVAIQATVADDVQVRNVELLVNGQVVQNAVSFPFDLSATLPTIAQAGTSPVTIQVEAVDTGGNVGLSNVLSVDLLRNSTPLTILDTNAPDGSAQNLSFHTITFDFSKPLDPATVTAATFKLEGPSGVISPLNIQFTNNNASIQLTYPALGLGNFAVVIDAPAVTDTDGNALGTTTITNHFQINYSEIWMNPNGGDWSVATNWSTGVVPGPGDTVLIDEPGNITITYSTGTTTIQSLTSNDALVISGGTLNVTQTMLVNNTLSLLGNSSASSGTLNVSQTLQVNNTFTIAGGILEHADVLAGTGGQGVTFLDGGENSNDPGVLVGITTGANLNLTASRSGVQIFDGLTLDNATVYLGDAANVSSGLVFLSSNQTLAGTGTIVFGQAANTIRSNPEDPSSTPVVTDINPAFGPPTGGSLVTISGFNLVNVLSVDFGATPATITSETATQIIATSPAGTGAVDVTVTTLGGTSADTPLDQFIYTTTTAPIVTGISPKSGAPAGGTAVTISGANLVDASEVLFGSQRGTITSDTSDQIVAISPPGAGIVDVTVTTAGGRSGTLTADQFTYSTPAPAVTLVSPPSGPATGGTSVTISGTNLANATSVTFGANKATITSDTATQIVATSPSGTATVDVKITTAGGTSAPSIADQFAYSPAPAPIVTGISSSSGPIAGGTTVTIVGTDLANATSVSFGGATAAIKTDTATQIVAISPLGSGTVDLTVTTPGGTSQTVPADQFTYQGTVPAPAVASITPAAGPSGTDVTITGANLIDATAVDFGKNAATIETDTATQIVVEVPSGSSTVDVTVVTAGGTSATSEDDEFTYSPAVTGIGLTTVGAALASGPDTGGTAVTISGSNLASASAVYFGPNPGAIISDTATQIVVRSPAGTGAVDVTVATPGGISSTTLADVFNYATLTIGPAITVRGSNGSFIGGTIVNQGTIAADDSGGPLGFIDDTDFSGDTPNAGFTISSSTAIDTSGVTDPLPQAVYQTAHSDIAFTYTLPNLTPGASYTLRLDFADLIYNAAGQQQFDVNANGTTVLSNFDIFAEAGGKDRAIAKDFTATANTNGQIEIAFTGATDSTAQVNAIELLSGTTVVQAIDCGLLPGGTIVISPSGSFQNQGTLAASNGGVLQIDGGGANSPVLNPFDPPDANQGLIGSLGNAQASGVGSKLLVSGSGYTVDPGLSLAGSTQSSITLAGYYSIDSALVVGSGQSLSLNGTWKLSAGASITATGATVNLGAAPNDAVPDKNAWINDGTINVTDSAVNLGGWFTKASLGTFARTGGTVNLIGTMDDTALPAYTDSSPSGLDNLPEDQLVTAQPQAAFDGNLQTAWNGSASVNLTAQFPAPITFDSVLLYASVVSTDDEVYTIYTSNDGVDFTQVATADRDVVQGSINTLAPITFPATTARYVRIYAFTDAADFGFSAPDVVLNEAQLQYNGEPVNPEGTSQTLALDATTGSWNLAGGTIIGGTFTTASGAALVGTDQSIELPDGSLQNGGTLDGVTFAGDMDLATYSSTVHIVGGLTLANSATIYLGNAAGSTSSVLDFDTTETLGGTGTVLIGASGANSVFSNTSDDAENLTLTIGSGITVRGSNGSISFIRPPADNSNSATIINQGTISADGSGAMVPGFVEDTDFTGGTAQFMNLPHGTDSADAINTTGVSNPAPQAVYQSCRLGNAFSYNLTGLTPGATYTVRLDFADFFFTFAGHTFNVTINGSPVLSNFDIFAAAGTPNTAVAKEFSATAGKNGQINIAFNDPSGNGNAQVNGIELFSGSTVVQAINCGDLPSGTIYVDSPAFQNQGTLEAVGGSSVMIGNKGFLNAGTLHAGAGSLISINEPLTQTSSATIAVDVGGTSSAQFGQINVSSAATLAGTLTVKLVNGFTPASGNRFAIMTFNSSTGTFATTNFPVLAGGLVIALAYDAATLTLDVSTSGGSAIASISPTAHGISVTKSAGFEQNNSTDAAAIDAIVAADLCSSMSPTDTFKHSSPADLENLSLILVDRDSSIASKSRRQL